MSRSDEQARAGVTNGAVIEAEIAWFARLLDLRFRIHGGELAEDDILERELAPPLAELRAALRRGGARRGARPGRAAGPDPGDIAASKASGARSFLIPNSQSARPLHRVRRR